MLQFFRSGLTSFFATALLGLLIASFALWGISGDILSGVGNNIAQIGDEKLTLNEYAREFQNKFTEIQQQSGGEVTRAMAVDRGIAQRWVGDLVQRKTFEHVAHKLNIRITDAQLRDFIKSAEVFQDTLGRFSKNKFDSIAQYQGYTSQEFENVLRQDLKRQYLMTAIVSGISVPETVQDTFITFLKEERTAEILTIPYSSITDIPAPDTETLKQYYQENAANYMAPEYRDIRFITLTPDNFTNEVTVTAEEIDQAMGAAADAPDVSETRDFQQLLFDDEATVRKAHEDLEGGAAFADIIARTGATLADASVRGYSMQDAIDTYGPDAAKSIFAAGKGAYTAPVETVFGWRLFYITNINADDAPDIETLRAETRQRLQEEKAFAMIYDKSEAINDEIAAGASLEEVAKAVGMEMKTALKVDSSGYNAEGDLAATVPNEPEFLNIVFQSQIGDEPYIEEYGNGKYFIHMVDEIYPPSLRPYEDVQTTVEQDWRQEMRQKKAREKAESIKERFQGLTSAEKAEDAENPSLADIAAENEDMAFNTVTVARNDQSGSVSQVIHGSIFSQDVGSIKVLPAADNNGYVIVRLLSRQMPDGSLPLAQEAQLKGLLAQEYQQRLLSNYWRHLEINLPVKFNERAVTAVHNQLTSREE